MRSETDTLATAIRACRLCVEAPKGAPLSHEPRPILQVSRRAKVIIASQAPGARAHGSGIPFDDPSGRRLRDWLGLEPEVFYDPDRIAIIPMGFCFPGYDSAKGDRPPRPECAGVWHETLFRAMDEAELILTIGLHSMRFHFDRLGCWPAAVDRAQPKMADVMIAWRAVLSASSRPRVLPLPHPSWRNNVWLKQNPWFETELLPVLRAEIARLTRRPSGYSVPVQPRERVDEIVI